MRPPGPLPIIPSRLRLFSRIIRRARGEIRSISPPTTTGAEASCCCSRLPDSCFSGAGSGVTSAFLSVNWLSSTFSPGAATTAIGEPTGTTSPADTRCRCTIPSALDCTSTVALSVSISASTAPLVTGSPSIITQRTRVPSAISKPSLGMLIVSAITTPP